ncbi:MAG: glycosyltransferase [Patescibacteria group bacterium]|jgi:hypothetical protein
MKDLHIVIVSWNTKSALERCLKSLPDACNGLDWECLVVDNASKDGTPEMMSKIITQEERIDFIANDSNIGFARAQNQGAVQHKARYILSLNPDTECPPKSLARLVHIADEKIEAAIMGPMLINADGSYHESVRRFPTWKDQSLILLKLHNFFPQWQVFKKYFCNDLNKDKEQKVDQVKGACFLVRQSFWDRVHGFDPRYFIWFEEVDLCKQAYEQGMTVRYEPTVKVIHHGGLSFSQVFSIKKQRYFNSSLRKYMYKWHGFWSWLAVTLLGPISMALAWGVAILGLGPKPPKELIEELAEAEQQDKKRKKTNNLKMLLVWFAGFMLIEILSFSFFSFPIANAILTGLIFIAMAILAYSEPALALVLAGSELIIGGFGYTFYFPAGDFRVSLRMAIMAGFMLGWGINGIKNRIWQYWKLSELFLFQAWVFVAIMVLAGLAQGLIKHQPYIFQDLNAWLFLAYLIPTLDIAHRFPATLKKHASIVFPAALACISLKILATFYIFTHSMQGLAMYWYDWVRDTLVGEITPAGGQIYRVFFQSSIYLLSIPLLIFAWWVEDVYQKSSIKQQWKKYESEGWRKKMVPWAWVISTAVLLISLSRSFWLGEAAAGLFVFILSVVHLKNLPFKAAAYALGGCVGAFVLVAAIMYFPWPNWQGGSLLGMFQSRGTVVDAAASSRWNLLPAMMAEINQEPVLGNGFGSTVTYKSNDPRVLQNNPDGMYTTYEFEWGWLGYWVKFGIFGIAIMGWLLISMIWRLRKSPYAWWIKVGAAGSLICLAAVHIFTPYLDHPLGFGWLIGMEGFLVLSHPDAWKNEAE